MTDNELDEVCYRMACAEIYGAYCGVLGDVNFPRTTGAKIKAWLECYGYSLVKDPEKAPESAGA